MENGPVAKRILQAQQSVAMLMAYLAVRNIFTAAMTRRTAILFSATRNEMPLAGFVDALQKWPVPQNKDWFAYKMNEPESRQAVVENLKAWRGVQL